MLIADLPYLGNDRKERMDLYVPEALAAEPRPAIVVIHGGGWRIGDKRDAREIGMVQTLTDAGYVCASVNYLLYTEEHPSWPTCFEDCRNAVRFLRHNSAQYNIDVGRIGAIGGSAGGSLSLLLGTPDAEAISGRVQAIVALYPPTDMLDWGDRVRVFGASKVDRPDLHRAASVVYQLTSDFPPTFLIHGTADKTVPHSQSEKLAAAMKQAGIEHQMQLIPDAPHTFKLQDRNIDIRERVTSFFKLHLARPAGHL